MPYRSLTADFLSRLRHSYKTNKKRRGMPRYVKVVYRGKNYRYKLESSTTQMMKLPPSPTNTVPKKFKNPTTKTTANDIDVGNNNMVVSSNDNATSATAMKELCALPSSSSTSVSWLLAWWKENWAILILNFGSLCTLTGFSRSDVLELRVLSIVGNVCFATYQFAQNPVRYIPIGWSALFASVNLLKTFEIITERSGKVAFTEEEEVIYTNHFKEHGVTPKQFQMILEHSSYCEIPKHHMILKENKPIPSKVYLVVKGQTLAHNPLGRHLTAISSRPSHKEEKEGGDSGAWIGEMAFLKWWNWKENTKIVATRNSSNLPPTRTTSQKNDRKDSTNRNETASKEEVLNSSNNNNNDHNKIENKNEFVPTNAMYSVRARTDCTLLCWTYEDMAALHRKSPDLRAALTRSMTAAIVGKVINFAVSRTTTTSPKQFLPSLW